MSLQEAQKLYTALKSGVESGNYDAAQTALESIKKLMLDLDSLPPILAESPNAHAERQLFMHALEYAVLLSANTGNQSDFQRYMSCLHPYYALFRIEKMSGNSPIVRGLYLLFLLVDNRLADFHCELELLSAEDQQHPAILFATQLEKYLVVGAYDRVLEAAANPPVQAFQFFLASLKETVRTNIGECLASAYESIDLPAATVMLMFTDPQETLDFIAACYPDWSVSGNMISFAPQAMDVGGVKLTHRFDTSIANKLITQTMSYATELERIV